MRVISVVPTPNPDALKFTLDTELVSDGSRSFTSKSGAAKDPIAAKIFELEGVTSVFYMGDFVTVNKAFDVSWDVLEPQILDTVKLVVAPGAAPANGALHETAVMEVPANKPFDEMTPAQRILLIDRLMEDEIRPGLAGDGGGLEIVGLEDFVLQIHYEGACGSCPSSSAGTLSYIENLLRERVDGRLKLVPV